MTTEENLNYVAAKEKEDVVLDDVQKKEFEKQDNWYLSRVFFPQSAQGLETVKAAICQFIKEKLEIEDKDFYNLVSIETFDESEQGCPSHTRIAYRSSMSSSYEAILKLYDKKGRVQLQVTYVAKQKQSFFTDDYDSDYDDDEKSIFTLFYHDIYNYIEEYLEKIGENRCPSCGEEIVGKGKFCSNCGATL